MAEAWIDGGAVPVEAAIGEAARILAASRLPVIAGMGADVAGARAAIRLAERVRGVVDHAAEDPALDDLAVLRESRLLTVAPLEARLRADLLLLAGPVPDRASGMLAYLLERPAGGPFRDGRRDVVALCGGAAAPEGAETLGRDPADLLPLLSALRARVAGQPCGEAPAPGAALDSLAERLTAARYGVAVWSADALGSLGIEMLAGLVHQLNGSARWSGVPLPGPANVMGANLAAAWICGFPLRTGFGRGFPEHDPWRFDARRLVESGEADAVLWIAALGPAAPAWRAGIPTIALLADDPTPDIAARVVVRVGRPGVDHDAALFDERLAALATRVAGRRSDRPPVAHVLDRIAEALPC